MKRLVALSFSLALILVLWVPAHGDGRPGAIKFSDGHVVTGSLSLSPGKDLRIFTGTGEVSLPLAEVREMRLKIEREEMRMGFCFPNAGQATQAKTGEVYPVRYFSVEILLADGNTIAGHLMTTTLYAESESKTQKVVLMAKITGGSGQKLDDIVFPASIKFDDAVQAGSTRINLTSVGFTPLNSPVIFARPDLAVVPATQEPGQPVWIIPEKDPGLILFSIETADGIHVAWPNSGATADPGLPPLLAASLANLHDFFDTRSVLGFFQADDDVYSLVMLKRAGATDSFQAGKIPWSLVALRWKYDEEQGKLTLLNRINLATGRAEDNSPVPAVLKQPELLKNITGTSAP